MEDLFAAGVELEWDLVERFRDELPNLKPGEVAGALRNVGVTKALDVDKSAPLRGRPTEVIGVQGYSNALEALKRKHPGLVVDGDAEETPEKA